MAMEDCAVIQQQNNDGSWGPAIPEPFFVGWRLRKCRCDCGRVFKSRDKYREHYAAGHLDFPFWQSR